MEVDYFEGTFLSPLAYQGHRFEPVRCVGNYNRDKRPAFPRCHNKFVVFASYGEEPPIHVSFPSDNAWLRPEAVWTGSFNFTRNAVCSFENAVIIRDREIVGAYLNEFAQIAAVSELLDWTSEWAEPEFFFGT